ncbi:MAG: hypothetical protein HQM13_21125 [SAR324 cluster bacterium]|nr:hypothetical protein [SAR324 cluster bacterium]
MAKKPVPKKAANISKLQTTTLAPYSVQRLPINGTQFQKEVIEIRELIRSSSSGTFMSRARSLVKGSHKDSRLDCSTLASINGRESVFSTHTKILSKDPKNVEARGTVVFGVANDPKGLNNHQMRQALIQGVVSCSYENLPVNAVNGLAKVYVQYLVDTLNVCKAAEGGATPQNKQKQLQQIKDVVTILSISIKRKLGATSSFFAKVKSFNFSPDEFKGEVTEGQLNSAYQLINCIAAIPLTRVYVLKLVEEAIKYKKDKYQTHFMKAVILGEQAIINLSLKKIKFKTDGDFGKILMDSLSAYGMAYKYLDLTNIDKSKITFIFNYVSFLHNFIKEEITQPGIIGLEKSVQKSQLKKARDVLHDIIAKIQDDADLAPDRFRLENLCTSVEGSLSKFS